METKRINRNEMQLKITLGAGRTRPLIWVKALLIEMPQDLSIGSAS